MKKRQSAKISTIFPGVDEMMGLTLSGLHATMLRKHCFHLCTKLNFHLSQMIEISMAKHTLRVRHREIQRSPVLDR